LQDHLAEDDPDERADERHEHRGERSEQRGEQQDRDRHAHELADGRLLLSGQVGDLPAHLHRDAVGLTGPGRLLERLAVVGLHVDGLLVVLDGRERGATVVGDRAAFSERIGDARHIRQLGERGDGAGDRRLLVRVAELPGARGEDDLARCTGRGGELRLQEVHGLLRLGPGDREVLRGAAVLRADDGADEDDGQDEAGEAPLPVRGE
jgi:hypothetical protein